MAIACLAGFLLAAPGATAATTIAVTRTDDPDSGTGSCATGGSCSLREAINTANGDSGDTVSVPAGTYDLAQPAPLTMSASMSLVGAGARKTIIVAAKGQNVVSVGNGITVTIGGARITGGHAENGAQGGGINNQGTLTLQDTTVTANEADGSVSPPLNNPPGTGGGIYDGTTGSLTVIDSTISGNLAKAGMGAGADGGGIFSFSSVTIVNSTVAGNSAQGGQLGYAKGGGIYIAGLGPPTLTLASATVAFNSTTGSPAQGGNIYLGSNITSAVKNSVIATGTAQSGTENCAGSGGLTSQGYNLEDRNQCGLKGPGDQVSKNAKLGTPRNNGGHTDTVALLSGSPGINGGDPAGCTDQNGSSLATDQRGFSRPQGSVCDIGAFEFRVPRLRGSPKVSGRPKVGQKLTCLLPAVQSPDGPARTAVSWLRGATQVASGTTYSVRSGDVGRKLACRVVATNSAGSVSATSPPVTARS